MPHDIFISYVEEDGEIASQVCNALELGGVRCWIAPRNIVPGRTWGAAIIEAITVSRAMVLVFSSRTNVSRQVARELERADNKGIRIVPFRIEDVPPSGDLEYFLGSIQWFDAFEGPLEVHLRRLTETLQTLVQEMENATQPNNNGLQEKALTGMSAEQRVLDAALSKRVPVEKPTELVAMFRCLNSEGLKAILQVDDDYSVGQEDVRSEAFELDFPRTSDGQLLPAELILKLDSPEFDPRSQQKKVRVPPKGDSEAYIFLLTPKRLGKLVVNLEVCKLDVSITSRFLTTMVEPADRPVFPPGKVLVSIPFYVVGYAPSGPPETAFQKPGVRHPATETQPSPVVSPSQSGGQPRLSPDEGFGADRPPSVTNPSPPAPARPAAPAARSSRFWIGGLSSVAALFICGIFVWLQIQPRNDGVHPLPPSADIGQGGQPAEQPSPGAILKDPEVKETAAEHRELTFMTGTLDQNGRALRRASGRSLVRIESLSASVKLLMVEIPAGRLSMGITETQARSLSIEHRRHRATAAETEELLQREMPQHQVQLEGFLIGRTEVTQAQWAVVASWEQVARKLREHPSEIRGAQLPVTNVSWREVDEFCRRLSAKTKQVYRLPSEAEWEYACRAETLGPFNVGPTITPQVANYLSRFPFGRVNPEPESGRPIVVGQLRMANAFGLYDMHGNVWEWCADPWHPDYSGAPSDGRIWIDGGDDRRRPVRGGGWNDIAFLARSSVRAPQPIDSASPWIGFRVIMEAAR